MNHAKRNPGIPKRPNLQKNTNVVLIGRTEYGPGPGARRSIEYSAEIVIFEI
jgi:hypothetical protein